MMDAHEWRDRIGTVWATHYALTDRMFAGLTQILLERLATVSGASICDIGCGAGELSLTLARARPYAAVVGLDISPDLIKVARERAEGHGNVQFVVGDAAQWQPDAGLAPDLLVSRHGVMFFPDPVQAFTHLRDMAAPAAQLVFSCFRSPAGNPWAREVADLLEVPRPADPYAPGPFAFAEEDHVRRILSRAGWRDIVLEPVDFTFVMGVGAQALHDSLLFFTDVGPAAEVLRMTQDPDHRELLIKRLRQWLLRWLDRDVVSFPAQAWIVSARKRD